MLRLFSSLVALPARGALLFLALTTAYVPALTVKMDVLITRVRSGLCLAFVRQLFAFSRLVIMAVSGRAMMRL